MRIAFREPGENPPMEAMTIYVCPRCGTSTGDIVPESYCLNPGHGEVRREPVNVLRVDELASWLRHIDRFDEIPAARLGMPARNALWDTAELIEEKFGGAS